MAILRGGRMARGGGTKAYISGPNSPGTTADSNAVGTVTWSDTGNIVSSNDSRATAALSDPMDAHSHYLVATNFGFSVPASATVDGVKVEIERSYTGALGTARDEVVKLVIGGSVTGSNLGATSTDWPLTTDAYATYGDATNLWGTTPTGSQISASDFGVAIQAQSNGAGASVSARVDHVRVTVYYRA